MQRFESETLNFILEYEIQHGNEIERVDVEMWQHCKLSIVMKKTLRIIEDTKNKEEVEKAVKYWECRDGHYEIQEGYFCNSTKEGIAAPLRDSSFLTGGRKYGLLQKICNFVFRKTP